MLRTLADVSARFGVAVLAGADALATPVRWATCCELPDPRPVLRGGELVLLYGVMLAATDVEAHREYVDRLVETGVAGVGFGVGRCHPQVPTALVDAAQERGLPLIELPRDVSFEDVELAISASVLRVRAAEAELLADGLAALTRAAVRGGQAQVVTTLARILDGWAVVIDRDGAARFATGGARLHIDDARAAASGYRRRVRHPGILVQPVGALGPLSPHLVVGTRPGQESLARQLSLQATELLAVAAAPIDQDLRAQTANQALDVLMLPRDRAVASVAERWGLGLERLTVARLRSRSRSVDLAETAARWVEELALPVIIGGAGAAVTAVMPALAVPLWRDRIASAAVADGMPVRCGLGTAVPAARLPESLAQANQALEIALADGVVVVAYDELPTSRMLLTGGAGSALVAHALSGLESAGPQAAELEKSLRVFLAENGSWESAAAQLGIHRHTLRHRIERVQQFTGRDLSRMEDRFELWLALRARALQTEESHDD